jgi:3-methyladenine DNA glycosylase AlkC
LRTQSTSLQHELTTALDNEDLDALVSALAARGSGTAAVGADPGTAKGADIALAARLIRSQTRQHADDLSEPVNHLLMHTDFNAHMVGLMLLSDVYASQPKAAQSLLQRHTDSGNWAVREYAGSCAGRILNQHFDEFYPVMKAWSKHASENVRRAVVIAAMEAAKANHPKHGAKLLQLLDPLMNDDSRYVRVNLGQFAISLALLKNYPQLTLKWLDKHSKRENEYARWNVAMVWSAVGGRLYAREGARLLHRLAADERRFVWRAVASAAVKLGQAKPEVVKPLLKKWKVDSKRRHVAEVVERYI